MVIDVIYFITAITGASTIATLMPRSRRKGVCPDGFELNVLLAFASGLLHQALRFMAKMSSTDFMKPAAAVTMGAVSREVAVAVELHIPLQFHRGKVS